MGQKGERHASAAVCVKERRKGRGTKEEKAEDQLGGRRTLDGVGLDRDIKRVPIFENDLRLAKGELAGTVEELWFNGSRQRQRTTASSQLTYRS